MTSFPLSVSDKDYILSREIQPFSRTLTKANQEACSHEKDGRRIKEKCQETEVIVNLNSNSGFKGIASQSTAKLIKLVKHQLDVPLLHSRHDATEKKSGTNYYKGLQRAHLKREDKREIHFGLAEPIVNNIEWTA